MSPRTRPWRALAAGLLALSTLAVAAPGAGAATTTTLPPKVTLKVGIVAGNPPAVVTAADQGYFKKRNLDVQFVSLGGGPALIAALAGGSVDLTYGDVFAWLSAVDNGFDIVQVAGANSRILGDRGGVIAVKGSSSIFRAKDLEGKHIGVPQTPLIKVLAREWLKANGADPTKVTFDNLVTGTALAPALAAGRVDAIAIGEPNYTQLNVDSGVRQIGNSYYDYVPKNATIAAYYGRRSWVKKNDSAVKRFVSAVRDGGDYYLKSTAKYRNAVGAKFGGVDLTDLEKKYPGLEQNALVNVHHQLINGPIDVKATQAWVKLGYAWDALDRYVDPAKYLYPTATAPRS